MDDEDMVDRIRADWAQMRPELDTAPIAVMGRILLAARLAQERSDAAMTAAGLTRAEFDLLSQLRRSLLPLRPGDLTRGIVGSPAATTKRLHRLGELGLVQRTADPLDGRAARVSLTEKGRQLIDDLLPRQLADEAELLAALTPQQQAQLGALLRVLLRAWEP
ncbi:MarR family transcriptional regulator [Microbacterium protaetiae]|uniref:MarR family transcriptional regulator n=1 Tax=Microbacterium protaetiae TaxID=2509458 RepID=A0A4P6EGI0_9MICO|nr:MarR family transcriptional regulator [Microbacterium protaetiae]QAY61560.1 MarR family transcriptional regulator [Microbacterium protaetiae]